MTGQTDLLELIAADPTHRGDREAIVTALRAAVAEHGTLLSFNQVRPHFPSWLFCKSVGATTSWLIGRGVLTEEGAPVKSDDTTGRNAGRWIPRYRVRLERLP